MEEDPKIELENQIELEKEAIPVPEQTLEAAVKRANAIVGKLRACKTDLNDRQVGELEHIAKKIRADILESDILSGDDEGHFEVKICTDPKECAANFETLAEECQDAADTIKEQKLEASRKLVMAAKRLAAGQYKNVSAEKIYANVKKLVADATKLDLMKNVSNIELKSDKPLKTVVDWKEVQKFSPGISPSSRLMELRVQDLKNIMSCLRGGKEMKE